MTINNTQDPATEDMTDEERFVESTIGHFEAESEEPKEEEKPQEGTEEEPQQEEEETTESQDETPEEPNPQEEPKEEEKPQEPQEEEKEEEMEEERYEAPPKQPSRLDKRIAQLYTQTRAIMGEDAPHINEVLDSISDYSLDEKKQALKNLLEQKKRLGGQDTKESQQEDREIEIEYEIERRLQEKEQEEFEWRRQQDLVRALEKHPELDEKSKHYDREVAVAVEQLYNSGMMVSDAYDLVMAPIQKQRQKQERQNLSGAVSGGQTTNSQQLTWEEVARLMEEDPAEYQKLVESGNLPD
jgi:hypothetical protein